MGLMVIEVAALPKRLTLFERRRWESLARLDLRHAHPPGGTELRFVGSVFGLGRGDLRVDHDGIL
jgi:hypothetical protein